MRMAPRDPASQPADQRDRTAPCLAPEARLVARAPPALGLCTALGGGVAGQGLTDRQGAAGLHAGARGRLPALVAPEGQALLPDAGGALAVDRQGQGCQPRLGGAPEARRVAHPRLGRPSAYHHEITPANARHQDVRQVRAPPRMGRGGGGCRPVGVRWAWRGTCGVPTSGGARLSRPSRLLWPDRGSTTRPEAQRRRPPQSGGSAVSAGLRGSQTSSRWVT
jgi:hypothetical protein